MFPIEAPPLRDGAPDYTATTTARRHAELPKLRARLAAIGLALNLVSFRLLQSGAEEHGFHFVTSWASSANNTLCSTDPWIWGLTAYENDQPTCDANYLPVLNGEICVELGALHPTENGIANLASLTTAAVNSAFFVTPASASVAVGATTGIQGGGFQPGETVRIQLVSGSTVVEIGTATADASGSFTASVTIPAGVEDGTRIRLAGKVAGPVRQPR